MLAPTIVCALCHRASEGHDYFGNCKDYKNDYEPNYVTQARAVRRLMNRERIRR